MGEPTGKLARVRDDFDELADRVSDKQQSWQGYAGKSPVEDRDWKHAERFVPASLTDELQRHGIRKLWEVSMREHGYPVTWLTHASEIQAVKERLR